MSTQTKAQLEQNFTKCDLIGALTLLLELDLNASRDLNKLSKDTLEQMFISYKRNALQSQRYTEEQIERARKHIIATSSGSITPRSRKSVASR